MRDAVPESDGLRPARAGRVELVARVPPRIAAGDHGRGGDASDLGFRLLATPRLVIGHPLLCRTR
jgi:hypothetical protein